MSKVLFMDMNADFGNSIEDKFRKLINKSNIKNEINPGEIVAIKLHVGEQGNLGYTSHNYARILVEELKSTKAKIFLTDTNTLYSGGRHNGIDHTITAIQHGFSYATIGAPFIPADGIRGTEYEEIEINKKNISKAKIASGILKADKIIFLSHFKGHLEAGFGGSLKNMAMGCASIAGKKEQHSNAKPTVDTKNCTGCKQCYIVCPENAISMTAENKAEINNEKCIGCGQCIAACNFSAINPSWETDNKEFIEKICEYAFATNKAFKNKAYYFNFGINITPDCDCWGCNDVAIVQDVGILFSKNPLALDKATLDLVSKSTKNPTSRLSDKIKNKKNIFMELREQINSNYTFDYSKDLGFSDNYDIEKIN